MQNSRDGGDVGRLAQAAGQRRALYAAVWRWHFYAGIFVAPFLLLLPLTGLVMLAAGPIERWQLGGMMSNRPGGSLAATHQARLEAARAALPGAVVVRYQPGRTAADATRVTLSARGGPHSVFVDAGTGLVLGAVKDSRLLPTIAQALHGSLLLGAFGDGLVEVAASLGMLLLVSGLYLWFPQGTGFWLSLRVGRENRRVAWRDLHKATGAVLSPALAFYLLSGLAWTQVWGGELVQGWSTLGAARAARRGAGEHKHGALNVGPGRVVPWSLEQTPLPAPASVGERARATPVSLDAVIAAAQREGIGDRFFVGRPEGADGVWTVAQTAMNADVTDPRRELLVHVDAYSGEVIGRAGWDDYGLVARGMSAGVPMHMGALGGLNLAGAAGVSLATLLLGLSGLVTWWLRRPARAFRLAAPPRPALARVPAATWITAVVLGVVFPLAGATLVAVALLDWALVRRLPALGRALS
ncbi:MAG: PepSY domain-containing protein [Vicinamibacteria bacterium]